MIKVTEVIKSFESEQIENLLRILFYSLRKPNGVFMIK
jgi:hypothetical protein